MTEFILACCKLEPRPATLLKKNFFTGIFKYSILLKLWINLLIYQKLEVHLFYWNTYFTILHMWLQQPCHVWCKSLYNNSSQLETVNYCHKESHLKYSWFLGPPLFINITVSIFVPEELSLAASEIFK